MLYAHTRSAYLLVLFIDVATYTLSALLMLRVPHVPPTPAEQAAGLLITTAVAWCERTRPQYDVVAPVC